MGSGKTTDLTIIFSNLSSSTQYLGLVAKISSMRITHVVYIGDKNSRFVKHLLEIQSIWKLTIIPLEKGKYPISLLTHLKELFRLYVLLKTYPTKQILASGQVASLMSCFASLGKKRRFDVVRHHGDEYVYDRDMKNVFFDKVICSISSNIICVSKTQAQFLISQGVNSNKIHVIYNSCPDLRNLKPREFRNSEQAQKILVISRQIPYKGVEIAVEGFARFLQLGGVGTLTLCGEIGESSEQVYSSLSSLPVSSFTIIDKWQTDMHKLYREHDTLIHVPTRPFAEAFGLVYIESLAFGLYGVFTSSGVIRDLADKVTGATIVPFQDASAVAEALLLKSTQNLDRLEFQNYLRDRFSQDRFEEEYMNFLSFT